MTTSACFSVKWFFIFHIQINNFILFWGLENFIQLDICGEVLGSGWFWCLAVPGVSIVSFRKKVKKVYNTYYFSQQISYNSDITTWILTNKYQGTYWKWSIVIGYHPFSTIVIITILRNMNTHPLAWRHGTYCWPPPLIIT